jgi:hypothetical protein
MATKKAFLGAVLGFCVSSGFAKDISQVTIQERQFVRQKAASAASLLNAYWDQQFREAGYRYSSPPVVRYTYRDGLKTGCTPAGETAGPTYAFYCQTDKKIYYEEYSMAVLVSFVAERAYFGSDGGSAVVATLAHEWGHAIRHQLSLMQNIRQPTAAALSLRFKAYGADATVSYNDSLPSEGEADCLAGAFVATTSIDAEHDGTAEWMYFISDTGTCWVNFYNKIDRYNLKEGANAFNKCILYETKVLAQGNIAHGDLERSLSFNAGYLQGTYERFHGPLKCGPLVNAWLARSPTKRMNLSAYCSEQLPYVRANPAAIKQRVARGETPVPFIRADLFCIMDALASVPDH